MIKHGYDINHQARAVACYMEQWDGLECSWSKNQERYMAEIDVTPWYNGRERSLCFTLTSWDLRLKPILHVICYEHRNSDDICLVYWTASHRGINPPCRWDDMPKGVMKDKWDTAFNFRVGEAMQAADKIHELMTAHWRGHYTEKAA